MVVTDTWMKWRSGAFLRRLAGPNPVKGGFLRALVLIGLLGHLILPLGVLPMGAADGLPGADICTSTLAGGEPSDGPSHSTDHACCAAHCLAGVTAGGLAGTAPRLLLPPNLGHVHGRAAASSDVSRTRPSPFAARAPPFLA